MDSNKKTILAIETSCDETAMALVNAKGKAQSEKENTIPEFEILAEVVASQIDIHRPYGGVVPSLAKREHLKNLPIVFKKIENQYRNLAKAIDYIAVTVGPGLEPALWTGINFAKECAEKCKVPLVGINHLEGHIYSNWLPSKIFNGGTSAIPKINFPAIVLIVSGGHTILLHMESMKKWTKLGETQDDAVGEAFDKVAKMLGLPYPGGPEVERATHQIIGSPTSINSIIFPRPMLHSGDYNFSFSGLKTAVFYYIRSHAPLLSSQSNTSIPHICAGFQEAAIDVLVKKTMRAAEEYGAQSLLLCGGVASNIALQDAFRSAIGALRFAVSFHVPELQYNTDNAVMIAAAAYLGNQYPVDIARGNLTI